MKIKKKSMMTCNKVHLNFKNKQDKKQINSYLAFLSLLSFLGILIRTVN